MNILEEISSALESVGQWVEQQFCLHSMFRPGLVRGNPGRICNECRKAEQLSEEEFFAQFGEQLTKAMKAKQAARKHR